MKTIKIIVVLLTVVFFLGGCALFVPPPWVESKTEIVKDEHGNVIESHHFRSIKGFSSNDPETAQTWADADQTARSKPGKDLQTNLYRKIPLHNNTKHYDVEVIGGAYKGIVLYPGQKSESRVVPIGEIAIPIKWVNSKTNAHGKKVKYKIVTSKTKDLKVR